MEKLTARLQAWGLLTFITGNDASNMAVVDSLVVGAPELGHWGWRRGETKQNDICPVCLVVSDRDLIRHFDDERVMVGLTVLCVVCFPLSRFCLLLTPAPFPPHSRPLPRLPHPRLHPTLPTFDE